MPGSSCNSSPWQTYRMGLACSGSLFNCRMRLMFIPDTLPKNLHYFTTYRVEPAVKRRIQWIAYFKTMNLVDETKHQKYFNLLLGQLV